MTITLDYADLEFDDDPEVLLADEYAFQYDLLYVSSAKITFARSGDQIAISANCTEAEQGA